jgi:hypothetical protein
VKDRSTGIFGSIIRETDFNTGSPLFDADIMGGKAPSESRFLNRYSLDHITGILDKVGLFSHLREKGFDDIVSDIFCDSEKIHYLRVYDRKKDPSHIIIDLRLSEGRFIPEGKETPYDMFFIEWLQSQNPRSRDFNQDRPQLPGQNRPGLGCLKYLTAMMEAVSEDLTRDGFLDVPDHFHLAVIYSRSFKFFSPEEEGKMLAILRDCSGRPLSDIAWGVVTKSIIEKKSGEAFLYTPSEEIFPISSRMKKYFSSHAYKKSCAETMRSLHFSLDMKKMESGKRKMLKNAVEA